MIDGVTFIEAGRAELNSSFIGVDPPLWP